MAADPNAPVGPAEPPHALEAELARRVFRLARRVALMVLVGYGVVFALANAALPALLAWAMAGLLAVATAHAARRGEWAAGLTGLAWTLAAGLVVSATLQGGLAGSSIWWLGTLPALLMHAHLHRQAVAMTVLLIAAVLLLHVAGLAGLLPTPVLMPLGDLQRAVSIVGSLVLLGLTNLRAHRWRDDLMAELRRSRAAAQEAIRVRERFVANMSHEIRTPLNGIVGAAELLRLSELDAGQRRAVDVLRRSVDALGNMVEDVLDFSQLDGGRLKVHLSPVDLRELLHDCVELVAAQAEAKGLQLWAHCGRTLPQTIVTDPMRLRQVLLKLLSNAVKFTEAGGVRLGAHVMPGSRGRPVLALTVRDTGIGMSAQQQAGLFEAFAQGDTTTTRRHGGAGLGLVICHALVRRLGGRIKVNSRLVGGSTFAVCLPWPHADAPPPPAPRHDIAGQRVWIVSPTPSLLRDLTAAVTEAGVVCEPLTELPDTVRLARASAAGLVVVLADDESLRRAGIGRATWAERLAAVGLGGVLLCGLSVTTDGVPATLVPLYKPARPARLFEALSAAAQRRRAPATRPARTAAAVAAAATPGPVATTGAAPAALAPPPARLRALLAEDNPVNQLIATALLERYGFEVQVAATGREALELFTQARAGPGFDVVLMDCHMPELDGFDATRALRGLELRDGGPRTPVIAVSADLEAHTSGKCQRAGMDDFIAKPVSLDRLGQVLRRWLVGASLAIH